MKKKLQPYLKISFPILKKFYFVIIYCIFLNHYLLYSQSGKCLTDIDGNGYNIVKIGDQVWMKENLSTTKLNDGTPIPLVTDNIELYNFYKVSTGKLCPTGMHVPKDADLTLLLAYLGGESIAGNKLKATDITHWASPNTGSTNESGFTALPGGIRFNGRFNNIGMYGFWWSSTGTYSGYIRFLTFDSPNITRSTQDMRTGLSVHCVN